ncbi:MAG: hypothetical protein ACRD4V_07630 [Candidatus Acidiferrales bacterium]
MKGERAVALDPRGQLALFHRAGFRSNGAKWERRLYKRLWARVQRLDQNIRREQAARMREQNKKPEVKKADAARHARWYRKHRRRVARYNARYHRENRRRHCGFCDRPAGPGRYSLRPANGRLACPRCFA